MIKAIIAEVDRRAQGLGQEILRRALAKPAICSCRLCILFKQHELAAKGFHLHDTYYEAVRKTRDIRHEAYIAWTEGVGNHCTSKWEWHHWVHQFEETWRNRRGIR